VAVPGVIIACADYRLSAQLIWVRMVITYICSIAYMYWKQIPDPVFGPKGLRMLLVLRRFTGFFGLSGLYFSLQYLSLSDAMVLSFLSPILTGFTGAIFLKEPFSLKEMFAGCKHYSNRTQRICYSSSVSV
ncbi:hypothetical protein EDB84DRAFT_1462573, partial [Lactarius hengduanensis]